MSFFKDLLNKCLFNGTLTQSQVDTALREIPDQDRQDIYFDPISREWKTLKDIIESKLAEVQGFYFQTEPTVLSEDQFANIRVDKRQKLMSSKEHLRIEEDLTTGSLTASGTHSDTLTSRYLINRITFLFVVAGTGNANITINAGLNSSNTKEVINEDYASGTHMKELEFTPSRYLSWDITTEASTTLTYAYLFFFSKSFLFLDEDDMASNSESAVASQQSIKAYIATNPNSALLNIVEDITPQLGGDLDLNSKNLDFPTTPNISDCLDEDNMVSDSPTKLVTQQSVKTFVENSIKESSLGLRLFLAQESDAVLTDWRVMCHEEPDDIKTEIFNATITADNQEIEQFITPAGCPSIFIFLKGYYNLHCHTYKFSGTKDIKLYWKLYKYETDTTQTLLGTSDESEVLEDTESEEDIHMWISADVSLDITDRLLLKVYARLEGTGTNPVVYFYVEGDTLTSLNIPTTLIETSHIEEVIAAALADGQYSRIDTGTYTGDGTGDWSNEIDCGFQAKYIVIYEDETADTVASVGFIYIPDGNKRGWYHTSAGGYHWAKDNRVRESTNGFEVSDDNANYDPNILNKDYVYMVLG